MNQVHSPRIIQDFSYTILAFLSVPMKFYMNVTLTQRCVYRYYIYIGGLNCM